MICPCLAVSNYLLAYSAFQCGCGQTNRFLCRSRRSNHYFVEIRVSSACWELFQEESVVGGGTISLAITSMWARTFFFAWSRSIKEESNRKHLYSTQQGAAA